jgi:AAA domain
MSAMTTAEWLQKVERENKEINDAITPDFLQGLNDLFEQYGGRIPLIIDLNAELRAEEKRPENKTEDGKKTPQYKYDLLISHLEGFLAETNEKLRGLRWHMASNLHIDGAKVSERTITMMLRGIMPPKSERTEAHTVEEFLANPELTTEPGVVVPYLCWESMQTMVSGREKVGKSSLVLAGCAAFTRGDDFLGQPTAGGTVLWLTEEHPKIILNRAIEFEVDQKRFLVQPLSRSPGGPIHQLRESVAQYRPDVVVVDTLYKFAQIEDENVSVYWYPVMQVFDEVAETGAGLIALHHAVKSGTGYRGSTALGGHVDAILDVRQPKGSPGRVRQIEGKGRLSMGEPFKVRLQGNHFDLFTQAQEAVVEATTLEHEIEDGLREYGPQSNMDTFATKISRKKSDVRKTMKTMHEDGRIAKSKDGWRLTTAEDELPALATVGV